MIPGTEGRQGERPTIHNVVLKKARNEEEQSNYKAPEIKPFVYTDVPLDPSTGEPITVVLPGPSPWNPIVKFLTLSIKEL